MCEGHAHALGAAVAGAALVMAAGDRSVTDFAMVAVFSAGFGVVNDIDHVSSTIKQTLGPATAGLSWAVRKATGGAPRRTHSILVIGLTACIVLFAQAYYRAGPAALGTAGAGIVQAAARVTLILLITMVTGGAIRGLAAWVNHNHTRQRAHHHHDDEPEFDAPHHHGEDAPRPTRRERAALAAARRAGHLRRRTHHGHVSELIGLAVAAAAVTTGWSVHLLMISQVTGMSAHVIMDGLTKEGVPLLWPVSSHDFHLLGPARFRTGGPVETVLTAALTIALGYLIMVRAGFTLPGHTLFS